MRVVVLPQTADEFNDTVDHYDEEQPGLERRFRDEVDRHIRWICQYARIPRLRPGGYRRVNLKAYSPQQRPSPRLRSVKSYRE